MMDAVLPSLDHLFALYFSSVTAFPFKFPLANELSIGLYLSSASFLLAYLFD